MTRASAPVGIDAVLFDLGGVLIELVGVERMLEWSPELGTTDELWRQWLHSPAVRRYETGNGTRAEFADAVIAEFGLPVGRDDFLTEFAWWPRALFAGAEELLASLAPDYTLASLSNTNELHWERFTREWSLPDRFHHNFPSYAVGRLKPDAGYFLHVLDALGLPPERTLFVDDNAINVEAAAKLGIVARQAVGVAGVRAVLEQLQLVDRAPPAPLPPPPAAVPPTT
jgi:putative hydrolase of the HAD superfamily